MDTLRKVLDLWKRGFLLLALVALALAAGALPAGLLITMAVAAFVGREGSELTWLLVLLPVWGPVWAGFVARDAYRYFPRDQGAPAREWRAAGIK